MIVANVAVVVSFFLPIRQRYQQLFLSGRTIENRRVSLHVRLQKQDGDWRRRGTLWQEIGE